MSILESAAQELDQSVDYYERMAQETRQAKRRPPMKRHKQYHGKGYQLIRYCHYCKRDTVHDSDRLYRQLLGMWVGVYCTVCKR